MPGRNRLDGGSGKLTPALVLFLAAVILPIFIIFQTPEEGIGFPLSVAGLSEGYDKLP